MTSPRTKRGPSLAVPPTANPLAIEEVGGTVRNGSQPLCVQRRWPASVRWVAIPLYTCTERSPLSPSRPSKAKSDNEYEMTVCHVDWVCRPPAGDMAQTRPQVRSTDHGQATPGASCLCCPLSVRRGLPCVGIRGLQPGQASSRPMMTRSAESGIGRGEDKLLSQTPNEWLTGVALGTVASGIPTFGRCGALRECG
jgi:hypothetical protein